jgi:hypothetical protein
MTVTAIGSRLLAIPITTRVTDPVVGDLTYTDCLPLPRWLHSPGRGIAFLWATYAMAPDSPVGHGASAGSEIDQPCRMETPSIARRGSWLPFGVCRNQDGEQAVLGIGRAGKSVKCARSRFFPAAAIRQLA